jgi:predicted GH43/DUF377 family glycosyl hydrolase
MALKTGQWKKLGQIFCPDGKQSWMVSHASNPWAEHREKQVFRIYFSTRDSQNRSSIAFLDLDLQNPSQILSCSEQPVLTYGTTGTFDDSGTSMGCLVSLDNGERYLYYLGWNLGKTIPWRNSIGLAVAQKGSEQFEKISLAPIMDRHHVDPYSLSYPAILWENKRFRMWYGSNQWGGERPEDMGHAIKYAESIDGLHWNRDGKAVLNFATEDEYAISRPCVIKDKNLYKMWYSYRGAAYRMGYAESEDGLRWTRLDHQVGIAPSASGWDSESIEYPCVFDHEGQRYMLYNGNDYGKTGFGLAILE